MSARIGAIELSLAVEIIVFYEPVGETAALQPRKLCARVGAPVRRLCRRAGLYLLS